MGFTQGVFNLLTDGSGNVTAVQMPTTETMLAPGTGQVVNEPAHQHAAAATDFAITAGGAN